LITLDSTRFSSRRQLAALFHFQEDKMMIPVVRVPTELQNHPQVQAHIRGIERYYNSDKFDRKQRTIASLHEGTHLFYMRACGFEPNVFGPGVGYDSSVKDFFLFDCSIQQLPYEIRMSAEPMLVAKCFLGPMYVEEKLLSHRIQEEIEYSSRFDLEQYNKWYDQRQQTNADVGDLTADKVRDAVLRDLRRPAFRKKLWDAAWEFEARVFGKPN
jgi:hypothetical protein